ncbi:UNVERIFIED_CONTAM: hypothetical protein GTU68_036171 [Idotea baltica]|nr:hypothetical protein [Idotea baltica]
MRVTSRLTIPPDELELTFARSGGPGGQNVNKIASKALLRFSIRESASLNPNQRHLLLQRLGGRLVGDGELLIQASNHREQARNVEDARERLASILREALTVQKKRKATRPTRSSQRKRMDAKTRRGKLKQDRRRNHE